MPTVQELLDELDQEAEATRRVLERVPEEQLDWRPHEKSLTLGQLAMHVATLPGAIAALSTQPAFDINTPIPRPGAKHVHELLTILDQSLAEARRVIGGMEDAGLLSPWHIVDGDRNVGTMPRAALLRSTLLNHWYHHRGQLTVYLRQTGAPVPAIYGDSADERAMP